MGSRTLRALTASAAIAVLGLCSAAGAADARYRYQPTKDYLGLATRPPLEKAPLAQGGPFYKDPQSGVYSIAADGSGRTYSAASDAWYGLWHYTRWSRLHKGRDLKIAKLAARWITAKQDPDGWFHVPTSYTIQVEHPIRLEQGWTSSLTQGMVASLFTRLFWATHNRDYLAVAERSLAPLALPIAQGGALVGFLDTNLPWYESYASVKDIRFFTLTHFVHTLVGLYDLSGYSPQAKSLFAAGRQTLDYALPYYDLGNRNVIWLLHLTRPDLQSQPVPTSGWSTEVMLPPLKALQSVSPSAQLALYIRKWE